MTSIARNRIPAALFALALGFNFVPAALAQTPGPVPGVAQVVALDECDPFSFNNALGADFCKNVTLGAFTTLPELLGDVIRGDTDPGWDFEPDRLNIKGQRSQPGWRAAHFH